MGRLTGTLTLIKHYEFEFMSKLIHQLIYLLICLFLNFQYRPGEIVKLNKYDTKENVEMGVHTK